VLFARVRGAMSADVRWEHAVVRQPWPPFGG
jgi:hypothetical protein